MIFGGLALSVPSNAASAWVAGAGLLVGDGLLGAAGKPLADVESLLRAVARAERYVPLRVMRGGKISIMELPLGEAGQAA